MKKVITYGTFDLLHYGHIRLLERAKSLGDYLVVGITADGFDKSRGKINVQQSLIERIEAVKATGLADEIIVEEYEGQKIDDIKRLNIDIFTVGSDWKGKFDYLRDYCEVIYLERTEGVSSSDIRTDHRKVRLGLVGENHILSKFENECNFVNGVEVVGCYSKLPQQINTKCDIIYDNFDSLLKNVDALYIISHPRKHYRQIKKALENKKHVICESPVSLSPDETIELFELAKKNRCVLFDGIKTAYSTAFSRLLLLIKSGIIGKVISIDVTCTSIEELTDVDFSIRWDSTTQWGPTALLPIFEILGIEYIESSIVSKMLNEKYNYDIFTKINLTYNDAVASIKVGNGVKSEGELVVSGEKGYIYVPAPWWKTDYFEVKFENQNDNKRYYYNLEGEGIRYMILSFIKSIESKKDMSYISLKTSVEISRVLDKAKENYTPLSV